jgi:hypothetical protein
VPVLSGFLDAVLVCLVGLVVGRVVLRFRHLPVSLGSSAMVRVLRLMKNDNWDRECFLLCRHKIILFLFNY